MKRTIKINERAKIAHIPKELIEQGFRGELDAYANAVTLTIVNEHASLESIQRSLEIVLEDIKLRRELLKEAKAEAKDD